MFGRQRQSVLDAKEAQELRELLDQFSTLVLDQRPKLVSLIRQISGPEHGTALLMAYRMGFIDSVRTQYSVADSTSLPDLLADIESDGRAEHASRKFFGALSEDIANDPIYSSFFTGGRHAGAAFLKLAEGERSDERVAEICEMLPQTVAEIVKHLHSQ